MLGMILMQRQHYDSAQSVFESILESNPKNALALVGLAANYKERHDFAKAVSLVEQALAIDPQNQEMRSELREHKEAYEKWKNQE